MQKLHAALIGLFFLLAACGQEPTALELLSTSLLRGIDGSASTRLYLAPNTLKGEVSFYVDGRLLVRDTINPFEAMVDEPKLMSGTHRASAVNRYKGVSKHLGNFSFTVASRLKGNVTLPTRAAFYYPWFPQTWSVNGEHVFYNPTLGYYRSDDQSVVDAHIKALDYAKVNVAIASWWGQGTHNEQARIPLLMNRTTALGSPLKWAFYYEKESYPNLPRSEIEADLAYLKTKYANEPTYAWVNGKPVMYVYNVGGSTCALVDKWMAAAKGEWYLVLKVFSGYRTCANQPDSWHQYAPANTTDHQRNYSYSISPGFWRADEPSARLERDLERFKQNVQDMVASNAPWQLVTTFNEWGEGTAVESADEWETAYLDALHNDGQTTTTPPTDPTPPTSDAVTVVAAGDIACDPTSSNFNGGDGTSSNCRHKYTAQVAAAQDPDAVLVLGDLQYDAGSYSNFMASYDLSWGKLKGITRPAIGNHEGTGSGSGRGYCQYFGSAAHCNANGSQDGAAYYSFDLGAWHIVVLNSNCGVAGGCGAGSTQLNWLTKDLANNTDKCTLAVWHHPRYSSGNHGNNSFMSAAWTALQNDGAELVLSGHDHNLERFGPQDANGNADSTGMRQFISGGGGKNLYSFGTIKPNSEFRAKSYGVLTLDLAAESYAWKFLSDTGATSDQGQATCN